MNKTIFTKEGKELIIKRTFDAPLKLVWKAWTEPELLDQWWAPEPWKSETKYMEFKEEGTRLYAMVGPKEERHWGLTRYKSIIPLEEFSGKDSFCDEEGNINTSLPVSFFTNEFDEKQGQTHVMIISEYASQEDLKKIIEMGFEEGLSMTFDSLDKLLEEKRKEI